MKNLQRKTWVALVAAMLLGTAAGCSNDSNEPFESINGRQVTLRASIEGAPQTSRAIVNDDYKLMWQADDAFLMYYKQDAGATTYSHATFTPEGADGTQTTASFTGGPLEGTAPNSFMCFYPASLSPTYESSRVYFNLPATIDYPSAGKQSIKPPMQATISSLDDHIHFEFLTGILRLTVNTSIAKEAKKLVITTDQAINGEFKGWVGEKEQLVSTLSSSEITDANKTVTVNLSFTAATTGPIVFYIPLPVNTYGFITAEIQDTGGNALYDKKTWTNIKVSRAEMLYDAFGFNTIDLSSVTDLAAAIKKALPTAPPADRQTTAIKLTGSYSASDKTVTVPTVGNSDVELQFEQLPDDMATAPVTIQSDDPSGGSALAVNEMSLQFPAGTSTDNKLSLTVNTPKTTITLKASTPPTGTEVTTHYEDVTATTAQNTLIVEKGVFIYGSLTIYGGHAQIYGGVQTVKRPDGATNTVFVYLAEGGVINDPPTDPNIIIIKEGDTADFSELDYYKMLIASYTGTWCDISGSVKLQQDLAFRFPIRVNDNGIYGGLTIDLNGHTLSATTDFGEEAAGSTRSVATRATAPDDEIPDALIICRPGASVQITDGSAEGDGIIDATNVTMGSEKCAAVKMAFEVGTRGGTFLLQKGTIKGNDYGVILKGDGNAFGNYDSTYSGTIEAVKAGSVGVRYQPIGGGQNFDIGYPINIIGDRAAVEIDCRGPLKSSIADGTYTSRATTFSIDGDVVSGAAFIVYRRGDGIMGFINGGTFNGVYAYYDKSITGIDGDWFIANGYFNGKVKRHYHTAFISGGTFKNFNPANAGAEDGNKSYINTDCKVTCNGTETTEAHSGDTDKEYLVVSK